MVLIPSITFNVPGLKIAHAIISMINDHKKKLRKQNPSRAQT
jgi:bifunctional pyridoxal-dependent enzyme with beta-cystathionase and maltose regulon repressor activities